jgi:iron complex outermembrane receptor protein
VEVIYGSNALQGIGATGGVVNQITAAALKQDGWSARTLLQGNAGDDFSAASLGGKIAGLVSFRSGGVDATAGVAFEQRGVFLDGRGRRIGYDGNQSEIQDTGSLSFFGRVGVDLSGTARFEVIANRFRLEGNNHYVPVEGSRAQGIPATTRRGETPGLPSTGLAEMVSASLTDSDLAGGTFALQGFYNRTSDTLAGGILATFQDAAIAPVGTLFEQSRNVSRKLGGKVSYERNVPGFDALTLTLGFDALIDRTAQPLVHTGRSWVPQTDFRSLAPFGQANLKLFDGLVRLAGGARYENVQLDIPDCSNRHLGIALRHRRHAFVQAGAVEWRRRAGADEGHPRLWQLCRRLYDRRYWPRAARDQPAQCADRRVSRPHAGNLEQSRARRRSEPGAAHRQRHLLLVVE